MFHKWISVTAETYTEMLSKINIYMMLWDKIYLDHMIITALSIYENNVEEIQ